MDTLFFKVYRNIFLKRKIDFYINRYIKKIKFIIFNNIPFEIKLKNTNIIYKVNKRINFSLYSFLDKYITILDKEDIIYIFSLLHLYRQNIKKILYVENYNFYNYDICYDIKYNISEKTYIKLLDVMKVMNIDYKLLCPYTDSSLDYLIKEICENIKLSKYTKYINILTYILNEGYFRKSYNVYCYDITSVKKFKFPYFRDPVTYNLYLLDYDVINSEAVNFIRMYNPIFNYIGYICNLDKNHIITEFVQDKECVSSYDIIESIIYEFDINIEINYVKLFKQMLSIYDMELYINNGYSEYYFKKIENEKIDSYIELLQKNNVNIYFITYKIVNMIKNIYNNNTKYSIIKKHNNIGGKYICDIFYDLFIDNENN